MSEPIQIDPVVHAASQSTVASMFLDRVRWAPKQAAIEAGDRILSYAQLNERVNRVANLLADTGVNRGDRIAILSENSIEYMECLLAAAKIGAILACQNWRLAPAELRHCLQLVAPVILLVSERYAEGVAELDIGAMPCMVFGQDLEGRIATASASEPVQRVEPEDPLLIIYTSGTTGLPKGATISHRAEVVRNIINCAEYGLGAGDTFIAWTPMYHMGAMDLSIGTLLSGNKVIVLDGFLPEKIAKIAARERLGWCIVMPGTVARVVEELKRLKTPPLGVKLCGVMADLVPGHELAEVTRLLDAPFANTFGATETGSPPCSGTLLKAGEIPSSLAKGQSVFCEVRLVDENDNDVPVGTPGELLIRGPAMFSGYWNADDVNAKDFRDGWFHMGDVLVRNPDGTLDFVDRLKYMIKSGGENIYPAEIERVLLSNEDVADAAVVRAQHDKWGETPIAFVARKDERLQVDELLALCRENLAGYKQPREIRFIDFEEFPRSASGKIQRHELEKRL